MAGRPSLKRSSISNRTAALSLPYLLRMTAACLVLMGLGACSTTPIPADSPAARYGAGGAATITGAYDFGLF